MGKMSTNMKMWLSAGMPLVLTLVFTLAVCALLWASKRYNRHLLKETSGIVALESQVAYESQGFSSDYGRHVIFLELGRMQDRIDSLEARLSTGSWESVQCRVKAGAVRDFERELAWADSLLADARRWKVSSHLYREDR